MNRSATGGAKRCDVFIAGAGIIGSTFARILVDGGARVLMADAGGCHSPRLGENKKNSWFNQRDLVQYGHFVRSQLHPASPKASGTCDDYPSPLVSYAVGGMAVHWTCAIPTFHPILERMSFISDPDWESLYARAASLLNRHLDVFSESLRHQAIQGRLTRNGWRVLDTPMAAERRPGSSLVTYTGADTVLGDLATCGSSTAFEVIGEHCVHRLVRSSANEHVIDHAQIMDLRTGNVTRIHADAFVVAAGWLHTAQILFASEIHTHSDSALGRYFSDHTFAACTVTLQQDLLAEIAAAAAGTPHPVSRWGIPSTDPAPHLYLPVDDGRPWQGMIFREAYQFDAAAHGEEDLRGIDLKWFGMIDPARDNRVVFSREHTDRLGMPAPSFRLKLSDKDLEIRTRMMTDMQQIAACLGAYRPGAEPGFAPLGSAIHGTGLARMGAPADGGAASVVDSYSKVWGVDNLYIGGTSVIATPTAANPTFTAVALAVRAAERLASVG